MERNLESNKNNKLAYEFLMNKLVSCFPLKDYIFSLLLYTFTSDNIKPHSYSFTFYIILKERIRNEFSLLKFYM